MLPRELQVNFPQAYYFIRANGETIHSDSSRPDCFVEGEPTATHGNPHYNAVPYCLENNIARIGWPDTGDLRHVPAKVGALKACYDFQLLKPHYQEYLLGFRDIAIGSGVLMPDRDRPGVLYSGNVISGYDYFYQLPEHPYECAHRIGASWDHQDLAPVEYDAVRDFGLGIRGGFWTRAFHRIDRTQKADLIRRINDARRAKNEPA
jgi:hypothetical protein